MTGTDGEADESHPFLARRPGSEEFLLVWKQESGGGSEILASRFVQAWTDPISVAFGLDLGEPRAIVRDDGTSRVFWIEDESTSPRFFIRILDASMAPVGPALEIDASAQELDLDGSPGATEVPFEADGRVVFPADIAGRERLVLFGVRDVPSPIGGNPVTALTRIDFLLPDGAQATGATVSSVNGRLFVRAVANGDLLYTRQVDASSWSEYRRVSLESLSREAVELLISEDMLSSNP